MFNYNSVVSIFLPRGLTILFCILYMGELRWKSFGISGILSALQNQNWFSVISLILIRTFKNLFHEQLTTIPWNGRHSWLYIIRFIIVSLVCVSFVHYLFVVQCIFVQGISFGHMTDRLVTFKPFVLVSVHPYGIGTFHAVLVGVRYTAGSSDKFRVWRSLNRSE